MPSRLQEEFDLHDTYDRVRSSVRPLSAALPEAAGRKPACPAQCLSYLNGGMHMTLASRCPFFFGRL